MRTDMIALTILGIAVMMLEVSGIWLMQLGNKTSQQSLKLVGKVVCWVAPVILIVGVFGLWIGYLRGNQ